MGDKKVEGPLHLRSTRSNTHTCLSKTHGTFHRLEIISVYKSLTPQKVFFSQRPGRQAQRRAPGPFIVKLFLFFSLPPTTTPLFISAITAQTDSSLAQLSSPIASISTSNLISPKERKADEQRRVERQREKRPAIMSICVCLEQQLYVFVCLCMVVFSPLCFSLSFCCCCPHSFYLLFFQRKKAFKGAIVQSG